MKEDYLLALLKISQKKSYRDDIIDGNFYANSSEFLKIMSNDSSELVVKNSDGRIGFWDAVVGKYPVVCFRAITGTRDNAKEGFINLSFTKSEITRLKNDFGAFVSVIVDVPQFLGLLLKRSEHFCYSMIDYLPPDCISRRGNPIFEKYSDFKHEHEFRIYRNDVLFELETELIRRNFNKLTNGTNIFISQDREGRPFIAQYSNNSIQFEGNPFDPTLHKDKKYYTQKELQENPGLHYLVKDLAITEIIKEYDIDSFVQPQQIKFVFHGEENQIKKCCRIR